MNSLPTHEGQLSAKGRRFALVASRFNSFIVEQLIAGATDTLLRHGASLDDLEVFKCPGAWELPLTVKRVAKTGRFDAVVALGAVIRGSTPHFDFVANEASKGLAAVSLDADLVVSFGLLTCDTIEQAIERAGTKAGNKGADAAMSAIEMVDLLSKVGEQL